MPWPGSSLLGCIAPAGIVSIVGALLGLAGSSPVAYGIPVVALTFAFIFIVVLIYQGSHAWVVSRGQIRRGWTFGNRYWAGSRSSPARSVVLKRALWPSRRGSTDKVLVVTDRPGPMSVLTVLNWDGSESRLATGGRRSLARTGPIVPDAPRPLAKVADETLRSSVSEAVRETIDLLVSELGVPLSFECDVPPPPPTRSRRPGF
jgi:hypothetical protein